MGKKAQKHRHSVVAASAAAPADAPVAADTAVASSSTPSAPAAAAPSTASAGSAFPLAPAFTDDGYGPYVDDGDADAAADSAALDADTDFLHLSLTGPADPSAVAAASAPVSSAFSVNVGPLVFFSVVDHYVRRPDALPRVVGVLLGVRSDDGTEVEVRNCFPLSHTEWNDKVSIDPDYLQQMYNLHQRVNSKEVIVGWYATGQSVVESSVHFHEYFANETFPFQPVHLLVDTSLTAGRLGIRAFVSTTVGVPASEYPGSMFLQVPCEVKLADGERGGLDIISSETPEEGGAPLLTDMDSLERSVLAVQEMLDGVAAYVAAVQLSEDEIAELFSKYES
ncbi:hypothetical protein HK405_013537, partial [Cladochytrium tenue]